MPGPDLRVHYGAASRLADDLRYQAQAESYIQFTPSRSTNLSRRTVDREIAKAPSSTGITSDCLLEDTRTAARHVNSQLLFLPSFVPRNSNGKQQTRPFLSTSATRSASKTSSASKSGATSHLVTPVLNSIVERQRHVPPSQSPTVAITDRLVARKLVTAAVTRTTHDDEVRVNAKSPSKASQRLSTDRATSQMPSTYSLSDVNASPGRSSYGRQITSNEQSSRSLKRASDAPRDVTFPPSDTPTPAMHNAQSSPKHVVKLIMPPTPVVSLSHFSTHITEKLHLLASDESLVKRYSPSSIRRTVEKSERGYWSLDIQAWSRSLQISFWQFLEDFVGCGSAGFGITCSLMAEANEVQGTQVKVFCWGEIVSHTYLVLYVASQGKLDSTLATWIAASGDVIMQVCPRTDMTYSRKLKRRRC